MANCSGVNVNCEGISDVTVRTALQWFTITCSALTSNDYIAGNGSF